MTDTLTENEDLPLLIHPDRWLRLEEDQLLILDRRRLPRVIEFLPCRDYEAVSKSIEEMVVQGAVDLAIAAGYGLVLAARRNRQNSSQKQGEELQRAAARLTATRPTGAYLARMMKDLLAAGLETLPRGGDASQAILQTLRRKIEERDEAAQRTGRFGAGVLSDGDSVMTHCFAASPLLYMLKSAKEEGKSLQVYSTETRPYLQGQRLTSFSVNQLGIPVTQITDNMPAHCMSRGLIDKVVTAADRVALDGSAANKVGTLQYAIAAHYHRLPFYILSYRGPDPDTLNGAAIPIEERDPGEVTSFAGIKIAADGIKGYYPAFDVTPPTLISGIITDRGIFPAHLIRDYLSGTKT